MFLHVFLCVRMMSGAGCSVVWQMPADFGMQPLWEDYAAVAKMLGMTFYRSFEILPEPMSKAP